LTINENCVFCQRIQRHEYSAIGEEPEVVWFEPLGPVIPGHLLFVPVHHIENAIASPYETAIAVESAASYAKVAGITDCNIITSSGSAATQTIMHLHVHLVPRFADDNLALPWTNQKR
jgi:histidine triad (HIT) family protein